MSCEHPKLDEESRCVYCDERVFFSVPSLKEQRRAKRFERFLLSLCSRWAEKQPATLPINLLIALRQLELVEKHKQRKTREH